MFNFKNSNSGKITVKLLATLLVLTLTFANFSLLGSYVGQAIAAEINLANQDDKTNSENVKFAVYLDEVNSGVKEKTADINSQEMKLYVSVSVQDGGYLQNTEIELIDTNFKFRDKPEVTNVKLGSIQAEKGIVKGIPVVAKNDESYNLALLDMQSQIKLTGEYVDEAGNVTDIDTTKAVKIIWAANELTNEDVVLSQEIITNKIYNIDGANKRVVQLLVKSNIKDNKAPVKSSVIEIENPQIGIDPEEVKVASYGTKATNGMESLWTSETENGVTSIEILNNANDDGIVSWRKNAEDVFVVTYIYDYDEEENVELSTFVSNVKNTVEVYGRTAKALENTNELPLEAIAEKGNIVKLENSITKDLYKGKMYIGEDTTYEEKTMLYVPYSEIANTITIEDKKDVVLAATEEGQEPGIVEGISTYYKTTKINKEDAQKVLGTEGTIKVYNAEDKTEAIQEIALSEEVEGDYYTISYGEDVSKIVIEMTSAKAEGTIEILNEKVITITDNSEVVKAVQLKTNKNLLVTDTIIIEENSNTIEIENLEVVNTVSLLEPKTTFGVSLDKTTLSTQVENDLKVTVELIAKDESNKLFNAPAIVIELPEEIEEAKIVENGVASLFYDNGLELDKAEIIKDENTGSKKLVITLKGGQEEYSANSSTITVDLKVKTNSFIADKNVVLNATCINNEEIAQTSRTMTLVSKQGLITKNKLTIGENVVEEINKNSLSANIKENINANISTTIMNNFGENISNINIVGNLPEGITLTGAITSTTEGVKVAYSEDLTNWVETVTDYSKIKAIKVSLAEMANGSVVNLGYGIFANIENIEASTALTNNIVVNYEINEQAKQEEIAFTLNAIKEEAINPVIEETEEETQENQEQTTMIEILPKTTVDTLYEGQIVTFEIKVKNTTTEKLENVTLDYAIPEGAVLTELTYSEATDIVFTDDTTTKNKTWEIETFDLGEIVTKEVTLKITDGASTIINKATLKDTENNVIAETECEPITINEGKISAILSRRDNMEIDLTSGNIIRYIVIVKNNTTENISNLKVTSKIPTETVWIEDSEYNLNWNHDKDNNKVECIIDSLAAGETKDIRFEVKISNLEKLDNVTAIENIAVVTTQEGENFETNIYRSNVSAAKWDIHMMAEHNSALNEGDPVKYIITVTNNGTRGSSVLIEDLLPEEIQLGKLTYYINETDKVEDETTYQKVEVFYPIEIGETLTVIIEGATHELDNTVQSKEISNVAKIDLGNGEYLESETIVNTIVNDIEAQPGEDGSGEDLGDVEDSEDNEDLVDPEQPGDDENTETPGDGENGEDSEKPGDNEDTEGTTEQDEYSISGLAWLDENKDGIRNNQEKVLQAIKVMLLDKEGNKLEETTTSLTGTYKFSNLDKSKEYVVVFDYDEEKYAVTKYQVENTNSEMNSDAISKQMLIDNQTIMVGATDIIKIEDKDIVNLDIGLVENPEFDLSLNKYISKVVVTNKEGTTTYEYDDTKLAKVEIGAKQISGTVLLVEYEIEIANEGDVNGYVTDIIDYLPSKLEFSSEMNTEWYLGTDNNLHYMALNPEPIEPGKTQTIKLVLTKTLKSDSTGTIENIAEISESISLETLKDKDSVAGNKQSGEDDIDSASLIISIRTGSPIMYIGIVIATMAILGIGIYYIDKKILRVRI